MYINYKAKMALFCRQAARCFIRMPPCLKVNACCSELFEKSGADLSRHPRCCSHFHKRLLSRHPPDTVSPPGKLKRYLVDNCIRLAEWYEGFLAKRYPKAFKIYNVFKIGIREFLSDTKDYYRVTTDLWSGKSLNKFSLRELMVYRQFPQDVRRVAPVLLISILPFANYVVFPLAYMFPSQLLSQQFWTEEQRLQISCGYLKRRLEHFQPIVSALYRQQHHLEDSPLKTQLNAVLKKLDHQSHPTVTEILSLKPLFEDFPCHLEKIPVKHARHLAKCLGLSLRRSKLTDDCLLLHYTDLAMKREGIDKLEDQDLEKACFWRGLNPLGVSRAERIQFLTKWTEVSSHLDEKSISLLLHTPVFLAHNEPSNKELLERRGKHPQ